MQARTLLGRLEERAATGRPVGVAVVGGGVFGSLYLAQARRTPGIHVVGVADLAPALVRERLIAAGWPDAALAARSAEDARRHGTTWLTDDAAGLIAAPGVEVVVEATGDAPAGVEHAPARDRGRAARRDGQRRGGRARRPAARAARPGGRRSSTRSPTAISRR